MSSSPSATPIGSAGLHGRALRLSARFWPKVDWREANECWPWMGARNRNGYGRFGLARGRSPALSHRIAWQLANEKEIPQGMFVCHRCDNPPCCNPAHLFLADHGGNMADMTRKGRSCIGERNGRAKLTADEETEIRERYLKSGKSMKVVGLQFGVHASTVHRIVHSHGLMGVLSAPSPEGGETGEGATAAGLMASGKNRDGPAAGASVGS